MSSACVVCGASIGAGAEVYSNLWEKSLKQHPCCSSRCAAAFRVTVHWIPLESPRPLDDASTEAWVERGRSRLHRGEAPETVVRELLVAGLQPALVRGALRSVLSDLECPPEEPSAVRHDRTLTWLTGFFGAVAALFTGWFFIAGTSRAWSGGSKANSDLVSVAEGDVDLWEKNFGIQSSR